MKEKKEYKITDIGGYVIFLMVFLFVFATIIIGVQLVALIVSAMLGGGVLASMVSLIIFILGVIAAWFMSNRIATNITERLFS